MFASINKFVETIEPYVQNAEKICVVFKPFKDKNQFNQVAVRVMGVAAQTKRKTICFDYKKVCSIFEADCVFLQFKPSFSRNVDSSKPYQTMEINLKPKSFAEGTEAEHYYYPALIIDFKGKSVDAIVKRAEDQMEDQRTLVIDDFEFA